MLILGQLLLLSIVCFGLGVATYHLAKSKKQAVLHLSSAVMLGALMGFLIGHFFESKEKIEGAEWLYAASFLAGSLINMLFLMRHRGHRHHIHCEHSHQSLMRFGSVLPHTFFDGGLWGLSLGFSREASFTVFLFLLVHRSMETISWMGLFSDLKPKRYFSYLTMLVLFFMAGGALGNSLGELGAHQMRIWVCFFAASLGYLMVAVVLELVEHFVKLTKPHRFYWCVCLIAGFVFTSLLSIFV